MDLGQAVEAMREDFAAMFDDSSLPSTASSNKDEVEAGFLTMRNLVGMMSAISQEYKAATQQATATSSTIVHRTAPPEAPAAEGGAATQATETAAVQAAVELPHPAEAAPVPDGPVQERSSNRERTPPPGKGSKAVSKMSDEELFGPRKAKLAKAGAAATA